MGAAARDPAERPLLVVTGLRAEARLLEGEGVVCVGAPPLVLRERIEAALGGRRPGAVVSFGLCGGLAPHLRPGALALPSRVVFESGEGWETDAALAARLLRAASVPFDRGDLLAVDAPVIASRDKLAHHRATGAATVDTESHVAARFAASLGVPFLVLRAVCDEAGRDLPPLALHAVGPDGRLAPRAIAGELLRRPGQLALLPGTALGAARAMRALRRVRSLLGPGLGLAGLGVGR